MLSKIRHLMNFRTLRSIYPVIFYCQKKLLASAPYINSRCLVIAKTTAEISNLFKYLDILRLSGTVTLENPYF